MSDDELDLVETEALIDALGRRKTAVLVVTVSDVNGSGTGAHSSEGAVTYWRGGWIAALGLARFATHDLLNNTTERRGEPS